MNKTMRYIKNIQRIGLLLMLPLAFASCTDVWNGHYDVDNQKQVADKSLWEEIASRPELQGFAECLKQHGYDVMLDGDQVYTVFAPQGTMNIEGLSDQKVKDEVLENHIARFAHSANSATRDKDVLMLNEKLVTFTQSGEAYTFGDVALSERNIIAKNGVLHVISSQVPFFYNVWDYLTTSPSYSKICDFMYSFNEYELNDEASVKGPIVNGLQTYVDSVVEIRNELHYLLGMLNDEDSTYTMVLPTNKAWEAAYERIYPYYNFSTKNEERDSLQDLYTKLGIVNDLVFSHTVQVSPEDSLISTSENVFYNPFDYILSDFGSFDDAVVCSNGNVFVVDSLRYFPWDSWHETLKIEAEYTNTHVIKESTTNEYNRTIPFSDPLYSKVSKGSYLELVPAKSSSKTEVDFNVWDVLSASYDIKVVFLPQRLATDKSIGIKPNFIEASLSYIDAKGRTQSQKLAQAKDSLFVDPTRIDTVHVGTFQFPATTYGEETASIKLNVKFAGGSKTTNMSRTMLIDCVIFEPTKE